MTPDTNETSGWTFDLDKISASVYKIIGRDSSGRLFDKVGTDPDRLINEVK